jgi:hypothetical protein
MKQNWWAAQDEGKGLMGACNQALRRTRTGRK